MNRQLACSLKQHPIGLCVLEPAGPIASRDCESWSVVEVAGLGDRQGWCIVALEAWNLEAERVGACSSLDDIEDIALAIERDPQAARRKSSGKRDRRLP